MTQKQWLLSNADLCNLQHALATEIASHKQGRIVAHHLRNLEELAAKLAAIQESTGREYYDEKDMDGTPCEQLLVTLIEQSYSDWWDEDPYTVIPVGAKWAVVFKETVERPVGEKLYTQRTHAYRACRRLNAAARAEAYAYPVGSNERSRSLLTMTAATRATTDAHVLDGSEKYPVDITKYANALVDQDLQQNERQTDDPTLYRTLFVDAYVDAFNKARQL